MKLLLPAFFYLIVKISGDDDSGWSLVGNPLVAAHPCNGSTDIQLTYEPGRSPEQENKYTLWIDKTFPDHTVIKLKFDKGATVKLSNKTFARIYLDTSADHAFRTKFFESHKGIGFHVQGCALGVVPYIQSVNINTKEYCEAPQMGLLDSYIEGYKDEAQSSCTNQQQNKVEYNVSCGKRQKLSDAIRENGESQRGDWPWHAAMFSTMGEILIYLCGGTLISKQHVLTVAHCVFKRGIPYRPEKLIVGLGIQDLRQKRKTGTLVKVENIFPHENFDNKSLKNDIAMLKLKNEVMLTEFIQPVCLWNENAHEKLASELLRGVIVGWGYDENEKLHLELSQANIPMVSTIACITSKPEFYSVYLDSKRFCAGDINVAVACNGDSGGGFHVFIPDKADDETTSGSWYIRGLISLGVPSDIKPTCSNDHYTVFTDVLKYRDWIINHI